MVKFRLLKEIKQNIHIELKNKYHYCYKEQSENLKRRGLIMK
jgi:hypothetical protein